MCGGRNRRRGGVVIDPKRAPSHLKSIRQRAPPMTSFYDESRPGDVLYALRALANLPLHVLAMMPLSRNATTAIISTISSVEIEDFDYDEERETFFYACPCGDKFQITKVYVIAGACAVLYAVDRTATDGIIIMHTRARSNLQDELMDGDEIARCPSCSLIIRVIYDPVGPRMMLPAAIVSVSFCSSSTATCLQ